MDGADLPEILLTVIDTTEVDREKSSKVRPDLVPARAILAAARAMTYGYAKHGGTTYRQAGCRQASAESHTASFLRHWLAYSSGELIDPESGLSHLDHAIAQLAIVIDLTEDPPQ